MSSQVHQNLIRLFGMSGLQIQSTLKSIEQDYKIQLSNKSSEGLSDLKHFARFDLDIRQRASKMSKHYELFYCLENSIRTIVREVLLKTFGSDWWEKGVDPKIKTDVADRILRDQDTGFTLRSEDNLDFANFGELSNIIEKQWELFDDLFTSKPAMKKVMWSLNTLRGPIAHCCDLAEAEVTRLDLTIKDWLRLME